MPEFVPKRAVPIIGRSCISVEFIGDDLTLLQQAAKSAGLSQPEFIRQAVRFAIQNMKEESQ